MYIKNGRPAGGAGAAAGGGILGEQAVGNPRVWLINSWSLLRSVIMLGSKGRGGQAGASEGNPHDRVNRHC